jgi:hypothetical protein
VVEKSSPVGSPRGRGEEGRARRPAAEAPARRRRPEGGPEGEGREGSRKSSNSSQDSGAGREASSLAGRRRAPPAIQAPSPEPPRESEVGERKKFGELSDVTNIELGMVKVPMELLDELIHKEPIEKYYTVDEVPVAR